jgi:hypothetical protein
MSQPTAEELEFLIVHDYSDAPIEAVKVLEKENGIPTAIAHHAEYGWFVIQTSGQGPYIIWSQLNS